MPYFLPEIDGEESADPCPQNEKPLKSYFLFVGRLEREKGVQDVIPLFDDATDNIVQIDDFRGGRTVSRTRALGRRAPLLRWPILRVLLPDSPDPGPTGGGGASALAWRVA